ncbi:MAG: hypothetical protein QOC86_2430, partial [Gaiellales bacterium]|nr:hypothetical protein [Gaiellales bacterium]
SENGAGETVANGAPAEPAAAVTAPGDRPPREPGAGRPRQQQRRRRSSGSGSSSGSGANGAPREAREPATAAVPKPEAPAPAAKREPAERGAANASEHDRRKGLISRILGK